MLVHFCGFLNKRHLSCDRLNTLISFCRSNVPQIDTTSFPYTSLAGQTFLSRTLVFSRTKKSGIALYKLPKAIKTVWRICPARKWILSCNLLEGCQLMAVIECQLGRMLLRSQKWSLNGPQNEVLMWALSKMNNKSFWAYNQKSLTSEAICFGLLGTSPALPS